VETERERLAHERERLAEERDGVADERDQVADRREHTAALREHAADERQKAADEREERLDGLEHQLDSRARETNTATADPRQRSMEALARAHGRTGEVSAGLGRAEAALNRETAADRREQWIIDQETVMTAQALARADPHAHPPEPVLREVVTRLRARFVEAAIDFADVEDALARHHDRHADECPDTAADHHRQAGQARDAARWAREAAHRVTKPAPDGHREV
jgi:hypothetical protein